MSSNAGENSAAEDDADLDAEFSLATEAIKQDPVLIAFNSLFHKIKEGIDTTAEQKLYALEIQQRLQNKDGNRSLATMEGFNTQKSGGSFKSNTF